MPKNSPEPTHILKLLSGAEIETLADYHGQGVLGVLFEDASGKKPTFHRLTDAYDDIIAKSTIENSELCLSTDSNRTHHSDLYPKRTCIEFRSGPKPEDNEALLELVKIYSDWLIIKKEGLRREKFRDYSHPTRKEEGVSHFLSISEFIAFYNTRSKTEVLEETLPKEIFDPKNAGPDFQFKFPEDARWVLELTYKDLAPRLDPVFFTQYNLSIPIGLVFAPETRIAFPTSSQFPLLLNEREVAPDFNTNRPHAKIAEYERAIHHSALQIADDAFNTYSIPDAALGAKDFLRGMIFELAMISTSYNYLASLFQDDALWIAEQQAQGQSNKPTKRDIDRIAVALADTVKKSIFSYFMKATLATFFQNLHLLEQILLRSITKNEIKSLCQAAVNLANGGVGNTKEHPSYFVPNYDSFMDVFDDFYSQTFHAAKVDPEKAPADPIAFLTTRFIAPSDLGVKECPVISVVLELRKPDQGNQKYEGILRMCKNFTKTHRQLLQGFASQEPNRQAMLHDLLRDYSEKPKPVRKRLPGAVVAPKPVDVTVRSEPQKAGLLSELEDPERIAQVSAGISNFACGLSRFSTNKLGVPEKITSNLVEMPEESLRALIDSNVSNYLKGQVRLHEDILVKVVMQQAGSKSLLNYCTYWIGLGHIVKINEGVAIANANNLKVLLKGFLAIANDSKEKDRTLCDAALLLFYLLKFTMAKTISEACVLSEQLGSSSINKDVLADYLTVLWANRDSNYVVNPNKSNMGSYSITLNALFLLLIDPQSKNPGLRAILNKYQDGSSMPNLEASPTSIQERDMNVPAPAKQVNLKRSSESSPSIVVHPSSLFSRPRRTPQPRRTHHQFDDQQSGENDGSSNLKRTKLK